MSNLGRNRFFFAGSLLLPGFFVGPGAVADGTEAATAALKSCVEQAMPDERKKARPNVEKLLQACDAELSAVLEMLPDAIRNDIKHEIRHQTDDKLKKGKKSR